MKRKPAPTPDRLRELFALRHDGRLVRRVARGGARAGDVAGCVQIDGYRTVRVDGARVLEHVAVYALLEGDAPEDLCITHRDLDRAANAPSNLRTATRSQASATRARPANNTTGFKGVSFHKRSGKYRAQIKVDGRKIHLGLFSDPDVAHAAYMSAARTHFGDFARAA